MAPIWIVLIEVLAPIHDEPTKTRPGFINVIASAEDVNQAESRVRAVLSEYDWHILCVESVTRVLPEMSYQDDLNKLIEQVAENPHFVLLSTLHTYKPN